MSTSSIDPNIEKAQVRLTEQVMDLPGVVGTMIGDCEGAPCLKVMVEAADEVVLEKIPSEFEGYRVEVMVTGEIRALEYRARTAGRRPEARRPPLR